MIKYIKGLFINTKTNVRAYTDTEILEIVRGLPSFIYIPAGDWFAWFSSKEDQTDVFDGKCYHFRGTKFVRVMSGTTRTGRWGLKNFKKYNKKGVAVIKTNEIYYDAFMKSDGKKVRHHRDRVQCLRQIKPLKYYRDGNMNDKAEEVGEIYEGIYYTNMHPNSYRFFKGIRTWIIGKSSLGCLVVNNLTKYWRSINEIPLFKPVTIAVLKED